MARPVGRPALPYDVKHVTINMKQEHYVRMRRDGTNMSKVINGFLDDLLAWSICPTCYSDDFEVKTCAKCEGRMLCCRNIACNKYGRGQRRECFAQPEPCSASEFLGQ